MVMKAFFSASYTGSGKPANLQCHSSAATATARWTVRYLCMCVLSQLVFLHYFSLC